MAGNGKKKLPRTRKTMDVRVMPIAVAHINVSGNVLLLR